MKQGKMEKQMEIGVRMQEMYGGALGEMKGTDTEATGTIWRQERQNSSTKMKQ